MNVLRKTEFDIHRKVRKRRRERKKKFIFNISCCTARSFHTAHKANSSTHAPFSLGRDDSVDVRKKERKIFHIVLSATRARALFGERILSFSVSFSQSTTPNPPNTHLAFRCCSPWDVCAACHCCLLFDTLSHRGTYPTRFLPFFMSSRVLWIVR